MKLQQARTPGMMVFTAHGPGYVMVGAARYEKPVVVMPDKVREDWPARDFASLQEDHFTWLLQLAPEVLLLGTGARLQFPHPRLYRQLSEAGIALECMDTPAACRTYNILAAEDRKVAAAILL